tara:strand:- start:238 stop:675 length:438 start_codon:yes stop_codon:yes gene_type:complete
MAESTTGPSYYKRGSIQVWDFIRDQRLSFHLGNAIKYICRYGHKGDYNAQLSDLNKAIHYLENERNHLQRSRNREDIPGHYPSDTIVFSGDRVSSSLQDSELEIPSSENQAAEPYHGGIQGIFGSGRDAISFGSAVSTGMSEGTS